MAAALAGLRPFSHASAALLGVRVFMPLVAGRVLRTSTRPTLQLLFLLRVSA